MDRQSRSKMNTQIYEEACAWFVECRGGDLDDVGRREFDRWLRKSPEHLSHISRSPRFGMKGHRSIPEVSGRRTH